MLLGLLYHPPCAERHGSDIPVASSQSSNALECLLPPQSPVECAEVRQQLTDPRIYCIRDLLLRMLPVGNIFQGVDAQQVQSRVGIEREHEVEPLVPVEVSDMTG